MLFRIFKIENSKNSAFKVAIFNLTLTIFLTILLGVFVFFIFEYYEYEDEEETADHVSNMIWVEVGLNVIFFPFGVLLAVGIKKDKYKWIRIWIKAKVVQVTYIFLLNFVIQVYITANLNVGDGLVVLAYTLTVGVFYMQNIVYMNNYQKSNSKEAEVEQNMEMERHLPDSHVIHV